MRTAITIFGIGSTMAIFATLGVVVFTLVGAETATATLLSTSSARILKTDVIVADVPISYKSGTAQVNGYTIQNPAGFSSDSAFRVPSILIGTNVSKSSPSIIFVDKIIIQRPLIALEIREGRINLMRLLQSTNSAKKNTSRELSGMKFIVSEILMENGEVNLIADTLGEFPISTPLPDSRLRNIGVAEDGISVEKLANQIAAFIIKSTERATRRIDLAGIAKDRGLPNPDIDLKKLLNE